MRKKAFLCISFVALLAAGTYGVMFPEYFPLAPAVHGVKTFEWVYGRTGSYQSYIEGSLTVPYTSGAIEGTGIVNHGNTSHFYATNDGSEVKWIAVFAVSDDDGRGYISTDCNLTAHPAAWTFSTVTDDMLVDPGTHYLVDTNLTTCVMENGWSLLFDIQDVKVPFGQYDDAVIIWYIDEDNTFTTLDFSGKDIDLGITLPNGIQTGGHSVTDFGIYAYGVGMIAYGDVESDDGILNELSVLVNHTTVSEHVHKIGISTTTYYHISHSYIPYYGFDAQILVDETVVSGTVQIPTGETYPLVFEGDETERWFSFYAEGAELADLITGGFASGIYTFTVNYSDGGSGSTSVNYALPNGDPIPYVDQKPSFLYPLHNDTDIPLAVTLLFEPAPNPDWTISLDWRPEPAEEEGLRGEVEYLPHETISYGPVILSPNQEYQFEIGFNHIVDTVNADGIWAVLDTDNEFDIHAETTSETDHAPSTIALEKCKAKAGKRANTDKISISGTMRDLTEDNLLNADQITIVIESETDDYEVCNESLTIDKSKIKKGKYTHKSKTGFSLKLDTKKGKFTLQGKNINLTGLSCPLALEIEVGNYFGEGTADESIVNKKKPIPIQFMSGYMDTLPPPLKIKAKNGKKEFTDSLAVKGGFSLKDEPGEIISMTLSLGGQSIHLTDDKGTFTYKRDKKTSKIKSVAYKTGKGETPQIKARFDFIKCSYSVSIKKTELKTTSGQTTFGVLIDMALSASDYNENVEVDLD